MKLTLLKSGHCTAHEAMLMRGGRWKSIEVPALVALIEHPPLGPILFDTGYSPRFFRDTQRWPYSLYAKLTPVTAPESETAATQLKAIGIDSADIRYLIISHFHADHLGGLADFPKAQYIFFEEAFESVRGKQGWAATKLAFLPDHLPPDFEQRSIAIKPEQMQSLPAKYAPFEQGVDLFGDGTLLAVDLPGHAHGQMGIFLQADNLGPVFLCADACWHSKAYRELIFPHPVVNLFHPDPAAYRQTLSKVHWLHQNQPDLKIIPSHCPETMNNYQLIINK